MDVREIVDYRGSPALGSRRVRQENYVIEGLGITFQNQIQRAGFFDNGILRYWFVRVISADSVVPGNIMAFSQATPDRLVLVPTAGNLRQMPCGVCQDTNFGGRWITLAIAGIALVLPEPGITAAAGNVAYTSVLNAGRANQAAAVPPAGADHFSEVGHFTTNGTGAGIATPAILHFN